MVGIAILGGIGVQDGLIAKTGGRPGFDSQHLHRDKGQHGMTCRDKNESVRLREKADEPLWGEPHCAKTQAAEGSGDGWHPSLRQ